MATLARAWRLEGALPVRQMGSMPAALIFVAALLLGVVTGFTVSARRGEQPVVVEIRTYELQDGTRPQFHRIVTAQVMPLLRSHDVDVVSFGPSVHDDRSYYLIRMYRGAAERGRSDETFYGSVEWRDGPREAILALIERYITVVLEMDPASAEQLRASLSAQSSREAGAP